MRKLATVIHPDTPLAGHRDISLSLTRLLANTYALYLKTQAYHWQIEARYYARFYHLTEAQYLELGMATDEIAERIQSAGYFTPGSFSQYLVLSTIPDYDGNDSDHHAILQSLMQSHKVVLGDARLAMKLLWRANDTRTVDLLAKRMMAHKKAIWTLAKLAGDSNLQKVLKLMEEH